MRMFYYDHRSGDSVRADVPVEATREEVVAKMRATLDDRHCNFVGIVDAAGTTMQFATRAVDGMIVLDIPDAKRDGSWQVWLTLDECCERVLQLGERIYPSDYDDVVFRAWDLREVPPWTELVARRS